MWIVTGSTKKNYLNGVGFDQYVLICSFKKEKMVQIFKYLSTTQDKVRNGLYLIENHFLKILMNKFDWNIQSFFYI